MNVKTPFERIKQLSPKSIDSLNLQQAWKKSAFIECLTPEQLQQCKWQVSYLNGHIQLLKKQQSFTKVSKKNQELRKRNSELIQYNKSAQQEIAKLQQNKQDYQKSNQELAERNESKSSKINRPNNLSDEQTAVINKINLHITSISQKVSNLDKITLPYKSQFQKELECFKCWLTSYDRVRGILVLIMMTLILTLVMNIDKNFQKGQWKGLWFLYTVIVLGIMSFVGWKIFRPIHLKVHPRSKLKDN